MRDEDEVSGEKIVRSISWFAELLGPPGPDQLERVADILTGNGYAVQTLRAMSARYGKPHSDRLVSDGKARIGGKTDFQNRYLRGVRVRPL